MDGQTERPVRSARTPFNPTVNLKRKGMSRVALPPRHEREPAASLLPPPSTNAQDLRIPRNPVPRLTDRRRRLGGVTKEPRIERLWRNLGDLSVGWFERDASYIQFTYGLREEIRGHFEPDYAARLLIRDGSKAVALLITSMFSKDKFFYIRTKFNAKAVELLKGDLSKVEVVLLRKAKRGWKQRSRVPTQAGPRRII